MSAPVRIAIAGGGICGLSAAYHLERTAAAHGRRVECRLFERAADLGGVIRTEIRDGFVMDLGPDALFRPKPAAEMLAREIGLGDDIVPALAQEKPTMIYYKRRLHALPEGLELMAPTRLMPLLRSTLLSTRGKLRLMMEPFVPARRDGAEESIAQFVTRRFGGEALERIAGPLLAGIHAGDPSRLSMSGTFPRLPDLERAHGSIARAIQRTRRSRPAGGGRRPPPFSSFKRGLGTLVQRLEGSITQVSLETNRGVRTLERQGGRFRLQMDDGDAWESDVCVLCLPADAASGVLAGIDREAARLAAGVRYVSTAAVYLGYKSEKGFHLPATTGFLITRGDHATMFGCTFVSNKFPGRAAEGTFLIRAFFGGDLRPEAMRLSDEEMIGVARETLFKILGLRQEPILTRVQRWPRSNPQYEVGHAARVATLIERLRAVPGLFLTGSGFLGVGVPDAVALGKRVAEDVDAYLGDRSAAITLTSGGAHPTV